MLIHGRFGTVFLEDWFAGERLTQWSHCGYNNYKKNAYQGLHRPANQLRIFFFEKIGAYDIIKGQFGMAFDIEEGMYR